MGGVLAPFRLSAPRAVMPQTWLAFDLSALFALNICHAGHVIPSFGQTKPKPPRTISHSQDQDEDEDQDPEPKPEPQLQPRASG